MNKTIMFLGMLAVSFANAQQEGRVGINTETPSATLNVKSKTGGITTDSKNLQLESSDGTKLLTVLNNGNLGIRVESPNDHMNIRDQIRFNWERRALGIGIAAGISSWNRGYNFTTTDGATNFGGFSAYGDNNTLNYFFIGQDYRYPIIKFDATTKNVGVGINGYNIAPSEKLHIAEGNVRINDLPNNVGATMDKIVVVDADGVLKSLDKAEVNKDQEWLYDATANRVNLRRSGETGDVAKFKNKIFYNTQNGQYVDIDNEKSLREVLFKSTGKTLNFIERNSSLEDSKINTRQVVHSESSNLLPSTHTNSKGTTSLYKRLSHQSMVVTETDKTPNYSTYITSITVPSTNTNDYTNVYGGNTDISLFGTGTLANTYATSGQVNIGNAQKVTGFVSGVLATSAINTSGSINAVYGLQSRNYFYSPTGATVTRSASGDFITYMPLDDNSLITQNIGVSNKLVNASKNSGNGAFMAGIYNEVEQSGSTKYTNQYGILTKSSIKGTVAPDNHYGVYIDNVEGGAQNNYSLYTGKGKVHLGDDVEVIGNLKVRPKVVTTNTCNNTEAGTIRFDATAKKFQGCTGTEWKDLHN